jgi:hypothetical protein
VIVSSDIEEVKSLDFPNIVFYDDRGGVEELATAIIAAFNKDIDQQKTREHAYEYTWSRIATQYQKILEGVCTSRKIE